MRILVTGGAGFIGSAVVRYIILNTSHEVFNIDKLTYAANLHNLDAVLPNSNYGFVQADICDSARISEVMSVFDPDIIIHLAAETHVDRSIDRAQIFVETNVIGTYVLLEAALRHYESISTARRRNFRFLHVSTDEVYGTLNHQGKFTESSPYAPNSPYSASKASSDMLARAWFHTYGLPVIISHCSNNYGPYQFPEKLLPVVILNAIAGRPIPIYGRGTNIRDWLHVEDHASALLRIGECGCPGQTYNIGGDCELQNIELVRMTCDILDRLNPSPDGPYERLIQFVADRPGHDIRYSVDASKLKSQLNWAPSIAIEQGLFSTVSWYIQNRDWWTAIYRAGFSGDRIGLKDR